MIDDPSLPSDRPRLLAIAPGLAIPLAEFRFEFARSGGPGGQNVNKVNSKAVLRWKPADSPSLPPPVLVRLMAQVGPRLTNEGELLIASQKTRDQGRNVADCLDKLRLLMLAVARPPKSRRPSRPTFASKLKRVENKVRRGATKKLRRKVDPD